MASFSLKLHVGDFFFIRLPRRRSASKISVTHTVRVVMFKGISMMFQNGLDVTKFVAREHRKNLFPSPGLKKSEQKARQNDSRKPILVAIDSQGRLSDK